MIRIYFVAVLLALTVVAGCQQKKYVHEADDYATLFPAGWRRTIGTDFVAGNNEYLYLNDLPMQWSADAPGSGYLYTTKPGKDAVVWRFEGQPGASWTIPVRDGTTLTCMHVSGAIFEIQVVKQTKYYAKVFYREKGDRGDQAASE